MRRGKTRTLGRNLDTATSARTVLLPTALGAIWPHAVADLLAFSGQVTVPLLQSAHHLGLDASARLVVRIIDAALWSVIFGALFGIPLGLLAKTKVVGAWLVFLASLLAFSFLDAHRGEMGIGIVLVAWSIPETWLYVVAVLGFALCTARLMVVKEAPRALAP
jgi:hypothetical protein